MLAAWEIRGNYLDGMNDPCSTIPRGSWISSSFTTDHLCSGGTLAIARIEGISKETAEYRCRSLGPIDNFEAWFFMVELTCIFRDPEGWP